MTLTEYLNQLTPAKRPTVQLSSNEAKLISEAKVGMDKLYLYEIPAIWEKWGVASEYISINNELELYTADNDGNKKHLSCFRLPKITK